VDIREKVLNDALTKEELKSVCITLLKHNMTLFYYIQSLQDKYPQLEREISRFIDEFVGPHSAECTQEEKK